MNGLRYIARRVGALSVLRNPRQLWVHYAVAFTLVLVLLMTIHFTSQAASERSRALAVTVEDSNNALYRAQVVLEQANLLANGVVSDDRALLDAITMMDAAHAALANHPTTSATISAKIEAFLSLARRMPDADGTGRLSLLTRLRNIFNFGGLRNDLLTQSADLAAEMSRIMTDSALMERRILAASLLVLLAEAALIFYPAQKLVFRAIARLERQAAILRRSRNRLAEMNKQLEYVVSHDPLTGLPNRKQLVQKLGAALADGSADGKSALIVCFDEFKAINDLLGPDYGDALLVALSRKLCSCVDTDDLVAHNGPEDFVLITTEKAEEVVRRIMKNIAEPFVIKGRRISMTASIGHVAITGRTRSAFQIIGDAALALQFARSGGGRRAIPFDESLRADLQRLQRLQSELPDAIRNGEIEAWFQPQVRLCDGRLHGAEALVRWRHPVHGILNPHQFLPAVERAGLQVELDFAVWTAALRQARSWQDSGLWRPLLSLNAAPDTLAHPHLIERFLLALQRSGLHTDQVVIEVLENTLFTGKDDLAAINIDHLAECGIAVELDDFGTGYASLANLTRLPLRGIKLDRSLVSLLPDQGADSILRALLAMSDELGLHVIAEGVEDAAQARHLAERGCGLCQGYGYGRPMPAETFRSWLKAHANAPLLLEPDVARSA